MTAKDRLAELYPTIALIKKDREKFSSWDSMAVYLGVRKWSLEAHRRVLGMERECAGRPPNKNFADIRAKQIDDNVRELAKESRLNVVRKYKIVDQEEFYKNVCGYSGLEFIGEESGSTWREISHAMPNGIGGCQ